MNMPVLDKARHERLHRSLMARWDVLVTVFQRRRLTSAGEGARGSWVDPDSKCATNGDDVAIRMAVDDFKTILSEIRKLK
jgi:hypothetical protein